MPLETDISNLRKRIYDITFGLDVAIKTQTELLNDLMILQKRKEDLLSEIRELEIKIDDFLNDAGNII